MHLNHAVGPIRLCSLNLVLTYTLVVVFDLLFLNEDCLLDFSLKKRRRNMVHVVEALEGRIQFVASRKGSTAKDVREVLTGVMEKNGEGLVLKHPLAKYILNGRNSDWVKVKPDYVVSERPFNTVQEFINDVALANRMVWGRQWISSS